MCGLLSTGQVAALKHVDRLTVRLRVRKRLTSLPALEQVGVEVIVSSRVNAQYTTFCAGLLKTAGC